MTTGTTAPARTDIFTAWPVGNRKGYYIVRICRQLPGISPVWPSGTVPGEYYFTCYMPTRNTNYSDYNRGKGCWLFQRSSTDYNYYRRIDYIAAGSAILGESNYGGMSSGCNQAALLSSWARNKSFSTGEAPAWNFHRNNSNFLFKEGNVSAVRYGNTFTTEYTFN